MAFTGLGILKIYRGFNIPAPGANTNIFEPVTPYSTASTLRITIVLATSSVLNLTVTQGATTMTCGLNKSVALAAGDLYTFCVGCSKDNSYSLRVETDGIINVLQVDEIIGGVSITNMF